MARGEQLPDTSISAKQTPHHTCQNNQEAGTDLMAQGEHRAMHQKPYSPKNDALSPSAELLLEHVSPSPQEADQLPPVKRLVFLAEKTYTGIEPQVIPPLAKSLTP